MATIYMWDREGNCFKHHGINILTGETWGIIVNFKNKTHVAITVWEGALRKHEELYFRCDHPPNINMFEHALDFFNQFVKNKE